MSQIEKLSSVTLGLSLKPFRDKSIEFISSKINELFSIWMPIIKEVRTIWLNFMIGNGDLVLCWDGNPHSEFEWDHYKGHNNPKYAGYKFNPIPLRDYTENWIHFTYEDLKSIFDMFKEIGKERFNLDVKISVNIEPGPEFSESRFRYIEHPEILEYQGGGHGRSIPFNAQFRQDRKRYAGYPEGIPEGEPFAKFMGKQIKEFANFMGIDGVSFSNGLGFGTHPWSLIGHNFDGEKFNIIDVQKEAIEIEKFWKLVRYSVPDITITAQGTNWPVGVDISAKCVPIKNVYNYLSRPLSTTVSVFFNDSLGFAMASYLSRVAPANSFDFGYYFLDPWYPQDAWEDFPYDHQAFDIYCPLSAGVINREGKITVAENIGISAINDDDGDFCEQDVYEVIPHIRKAIIDRPDSPGILVWLYPFDEYHLCIEKIPESINNLFFWDCFTASSIDNSLPLNTVISSSNFNQDIFKVLDNSILYTPVPLFGSSYTKDLINFVEKGGKVILYGSILCTDEIIKDLLNLKVGEGIDGELELSINNKLIPSSEREIISHYSNISGGPIVEELTNINDPYTHILVEARKDGKRKIYSLVRELPNWNGGRVVWIRGTLPFTLKGENIVYNNLTPTKIPVSLLKLFGYEITQFPDEPRIQIFVSKKRNAYIFSGYEPDNSVELRLRFPDGAPIFFNYTVPIREGNAIYHLPKAFHEECRIFVKQDSGKIKCRRTLRHEFTEDEIELSGLENAELTFYCPEDKLDRVAIGPDKYEYRKDLEHGKLKINSITGRIIISW